VLVAGWQHYLAYDLFLGAWIAKRLDAAEIGRVLQWPVLALCFMAGPVGFLLGLGLEGLVRLWRRQGASLSLSEKVA
ncbi:MAG: abscisic acid-deficient protein Aba4 family protein, partial [Pseudomonadota bacterium]